MQEQPYMYSLEMKVRDYEVDAEGIVNNAVYLHYLEHTRHEFCAQAGISFARMRELGIDPVLSRVEIDYRAPLRSGERFVSSLSLRREGARFVFRQDIHTADGRLAVAARVECVALVNGRLSRGDELAAHFAAYL